MFIHTGNWDSFKEKLDNLPSFSTEKELCAFFGFEYMKYHNITTNALYGWIHSPSRSLFNGIAFAKDEFPKENTQVFSDLMTQTRFLLILKEYSFLRRAYTQNVRDENNEIIKVRGENALQLYTSSTSQPQPIIDEVLQTLYLYKFLNASKLITAKKKPKTLYRGIRLHTIVNMPIIKEEINALMKKDNRDVHHTVKLYDATVNCLKGKSLSSISDVPLLSFTSSMKTAEYFANNIGIVLEIKFNESDVFTSPLTEERLDDADAVSKRKENEYIVYPNDAVIQDVHISHLEYFMYTNHPKGVNYFSHNNQVAYYTLEGKRIRASFVWTSNTTHTTNYALMEGKDNWSYSSREFKKVFGFSPLITAKNIHLIEDLEYRLNGKTISIQQNAYA